MPEITTSIEVEVWCSCGEGLCNQSEAESRGRGVIVEPCEKCLDRRYDEGHADGYEQAEKDLAE